MTRGQSGLTISFSHRVSAASRSRTTSGWTGARLRRSLLSVARSKRTVRPLISSFTSFQSPWRIALWYSERQKSVSWGAAMVWPVKKGSSETPS